MKNVCFRRRSTPSSITAAAAVPVTGPNNRALKSLSDMLRGKQGRFRQNLLGKRVDYSGRRRYRCRPGIENIPVRPAEGDGAGAFQAVCHEKTCGRRHSKQYQERQKDVERARTEVWDALEDIISEHPVLLNRAPTLHRLGIQAVWSRYWLRAARLSCIRLSVRRLMQTLMAIRWQCMCRCPLKHRPKPAF